MQDERNDSAMQVEKLKEEIKDRFTQELTQKTTDNMRSEGILSERVSLLEKEVSKLEVQLLQSKKIESELRDKCETLRQKNDSLQLEIFK